MPPGGPHTPLTTRAARCTSSSRGAGSQKPITIRTTSRTTIDVSRHGYQSVRASSEEPSTSPLTCSATPPKTAAPKTMKSAPVHKCPVPKAARRSEEHTSELQSLRHLVCRLLLEKN